MGALRFEELVVTPLGTTEPRFGPTLTGAETSGRATLYDVTGPHGLHLRIADTSWSNGERDVRVEERYDSPQTFDQLVGRVRLGVYRAAELLWVELRQARMKVPNRCTLHHATAAELDAGAGVVVRAALLECGATEVGMREDVFGDSSRKRRFMCATFQEKATTVPVVAFVLTRVAPVMRGMCADGSRLGGGVAPRG